jgi:hypothetical protein
MSYSYNYKLKNISGQKTIEQTDLHNFVGLTLTQRRINHKLISTCKLTDANGYSTTLDSDDRQNDVFDFIFEWQKANQIH